MSFEPIIPISGIGGWNFLQSTYDKQLDSFSKSPVLQRDTEYFEENIGNVKTVDDLVNDRRLLSVALGAFGLEDQVDYKGLVKKVLQEGSTADDALAGKLGDDRWVSFTETFGFGPGETVKTGDAAAMKNLSEIYKVQSFETAVGEQDNSMRVAMYSQREIQVLAEDGTSTDTKWFNVMGQPAIREMFEIALGLPTSMGQADLDTQLANFKDRAKAMFGTDDISVFAEPENMERLVNVYLARSEIAEFNASNSAGATALMLLQS
ncbi:MAG: flagellar protein [Roseobacter sp. MedPE-SWchi]|nr:MAG: flagellar protein [Roseobacter sp. MedPE-SWchi]